jgi:hypothetical protein
MTPETGTKRKFKRWLLSELCGWTCYNGHVVMRWEQTLYGYDALMSFQCGYCKLHCQTVFRKALVRSGHNV